MPEMRTFIAVELSPALRKRIETLQNELKSATSDVRWVRSEGIHLTLKFLGSVDEARVDEIGKRIEQCLDDKTVFTVTVGSLGAFPSKKHPQVIWLGIRDEHGFLEKIQQALERNLATLGFAAEKRTFSPHLTLGRIKSPEAKRTVRQLLERTGDGECFSFDVREICFFKSDLKPGGAVYTKLKTCALRPRAQQP